MESSSRSHGKRLTLVEHCHWANAPWYVNVYTEHRSDQFHTYVERTIHYAGGARTSTFAYASYDEAGRRHNHHRWVSAEPDFNPANNSHAY